MSLCVRRLKDNETEEELIEAFKIFDANANGTVLVSELRHAMLNLKDKPTDEEIDEFIKDSDPDNDGII